LSIKEYGFLTFFYGSLANIGFESKERNFLNINLVEIVEKRDMSVL